MTPPPPTRASSDQSPSDSVWAQFQDHLAASGRKPSTRRAYLRALEHFSYWLNIQGRDLQSPSDRDVGAFLTEHLPVCACPGRARRERKTVRAALHIYLGLLGMPKEPAVWPQPIATTVAAFDTHMDHVAGLAPATRTFRRRQAADFLIHHFPDGHLRYSSLTPSRIRAYSIGRVSTLKPAGGASMASALRAFLRFLRLTGRIQTQLANAVPQTSVVRWAQPPRALPPEEVARLLASFDRETPVGQRDYAMSRCLVDLGLRTSEVALLRLDHIHWAQGLLTQPAAKSRQARTLPMPAPTGEALAAYLQHARPATACRALFVRHSGGIAPVTAPSVRSAMRRAFERAGIPASLSQVHRLRHSTATRMLAAGVPFKTIADVLGHQSFDTTGRYLAVATEGLGAIAAPWPTADSS